MIYNIWRRQFVSMLLWWLEYDIALEQQRLEHLRRCIEFDKAKKLALQHELMQLELGRTR